MSETTTEAATNGTPAQPPPALATPSRSQQIAAALEKAAAKAKAAVPAPGIAANDAPVPAEAPANDGAEAKPEPAASDPLNDKEFLRKMREAVGNDPASWRVLQELVKFKNPTEAFVALKQRTKDLAKRERELETKSSETAKLQQELAELDQLRKTNPREFVRRANVTIRELAEEEVNQEPEEKRAVRELRAELDALKKEREENAAQDKQTAAQRQTEWVLGDIQRRWSEEFGDRYEFLHAFEPANIARTAWAKMQEYFAEHSEALPLDVVLDGLEEEAKALHENLTKGRRRAGINSDESPSRSKDGRSPGGNGQGPSERGNGAGQPAKPAAADDPPATLSNADVADRGGPPEKPRSPKEYRERAHLLAQRRAAATKQ